MAGEVVEDPGSTAARRKMAMFPLGTVLFPTAALPLHVFEERYRTMIGECLEGEREFGVVLISRGSEVGGGDERCQIGTIAHIEVASPFPDGRFALVCEGRQRIAIHEWLPEAPYPNAIVEVISSPAAGETGALVADAERAVRRARALLSELGEAPAMAADASFSEDPEVASWQLCAVSPLNPLDAQRLLETDRTSTRLETLARFCDELADDLGRVLGEGGSPPG
jgi:uncharacterized protein